MTILLTFTNETSTTINVSTSFTMDMVNDCFLNKDFKGMGIVAKTEKSFITVI
jgi:hypothetical protein